MGAPSLDQPAVSRRLLSNAARQLGDCRQKVLLDRPRNGDVHGGRETVVGALCTVDVVVGVDRALAAARTTGQLVGASGDDLIDVHVALGAAAGLPDHQRKLIVVLTMKDLVRGLFDQAGDVRR